LCECLVENIKAAVYGGDGVVDVQRRSMVEACTLQVTSLTQLIRHTRLPMPTASSTSTSHWCSLESSYKVGSP